jgi:hypothetical protein
MARRMRPQPGIGKPLDLAGPPENGTHNLAIAGLGFQRPRLCGVMAKPILGSEATGQQLKL